MSFIDQINILLFRMCPSLRHDNIGVAKTFFNFFRSLLLSVVSVNRGSSRRFRQVSYSIGHDSYESSFRAFCQRTAENVCVCHANAPRSLLNEFEDRRGTEKQQTYCNISKNPSHVRIIPYLIVMGPPLVHFSCQSVGYHLMKAVEQTT
jgi:hypothetical protein